MQAEMQKAQEEMATTTVTGESGAGLVKITMTCKHEVRALEIDDSLVGAVVVVGDLVPQVGQLPQSSWQPRQEFSSVERLMLNVSPLAA